MFNLLVRKLNCSSRRVPLLTNKIGRLERHCERSVASLRNGKGTEKTENRKGKNSVKIMGDKKILKHIGIEYLIKTSTQI